MNRQVGAVIVDVNNRPISVGYNGKPAHYKGDNETCKSFCPRGGASVESRTDRYGNCVSVHAEVNALLFADRREYVGGSIYITNPCCWDCAKIVANSGLSKVVMFLSEHDSHADWETPKSFLEQCGLQVKIVRKEN